MVMVNSHDNFIKKVWDLDVSDNKNDVNIIIEESWSRRNIDGIDLLVDVYRSVHLQLFISLQFFRSLSFSLRSFLGVT